MARFKASEILWIFARISGSLIGGFYGLEIVAKNSINNLPIIGNYSLIIVLLGCLGGWLLMPDLAYALVMVYGVASSFFHSFRPGFDCGLMGAYMKFVFDNCFNNGHAGDFSLIAIVLGGLACIFALDPLLSDIGVVDVTWIHLAFLLIVGLISFFTAVRERRKRVKFGKSPSIYRSEKWALGDGISLNRINGLYVTGLNEYDRNFGNVSLLRFFEDGLVMETSLAQEIRSEEEFKELWSKISLCFDRKDAYRYSFGEYFLENDKIEFNTMSVQGKISFNGDYKSKYLMYLDSFSHINGQRATGKAYHYINIS